MAMRIVPKNILAKYPKLQKGESHLNVENMQIERLYRNVVAVFFFS